MTEEEKKLGAQKYFVFKIIEYFRNCYGVLQNKRYDSLVAMCREIADIQDEINRSKIDTSHLQKSLDSLLEAFRYQWTDHPLVKHEFLRRDITSIVSRIKTDKENDNDYYMTIYNSITSILKKVMGQAAVRLYIEVIKEEVLTFGEIDKLLDSFVSHLLYQGYSLKYLEEWYLNNIQPMVKECTLDSGYLEKILDFMGDIGCDNNNFYVIFACRLPRALQKEFQEQKKVRIRELIVINDDEKIKSLREKFNLDERQKYLYTELQACDKYKAVELIRKSIEGYSEIYKILTQSNKSIINDKTIFYISGDREEWERIVLEDIVYVNNRMVVINKQEREDIQDLILLRKYFNYTHKTYTDISIIERTLEITRNALELSSENRLLNIWSGLEYLSTFYYRDKIIERVRSIIPKVICLYYLKSKMNMLWDRMKYYRNKSIREPIKCFFDDCCREGKDYEYDLENYAKIMSDMDSAKELYKEFDFNIIIQREISELNSLLINKDGILLNAIKDTNELIKQDLNRIYRVRNKLAHSGNNIPENIDTFTYRLYRYVNSLISTLIYHIKRNPELTITEILYSIVETYEWYVEFVSSVEKDKPIQNIKDIIAPRYLYL